MPPPRLTQSHRGEHVGVAVGDVASTWAARPSKSSFSQLKWNISPEIDGADGPQRVDVDDAEARVPAGRVGEVERRVADAGVDPQPDRGARHDAGEARPAATAS